MRAFYFGMKSYENSHFCHTSHSHIAIHSPWAYYGENGPNSKSLFSAHVSVYCEAARIRLLSGTFSTCTWHQSCTVSHHFYENSCESKTSPVRGNLVMLAQHPKRSYPSITTGQLSPKNTPRLFLFTWMFYYLLLFFLIFLRAANIKHKIDQHGRGWQGWRVIFERRGWWWFGLWGGSNTAECECTGEVVSAGPRRTGGECSPRVWELTCWSQTDAKVVACF